MLVTWQFRTRARFRLLLVATALVAILGLVVAPGVIATPMEPAGATGGTDPVPGGGRSVTLITGDRVHVHDVGDGRTAAVIDPAPRADGRVPQFVTRSDGERTLVLPSDVRSLVPHVLDPALFDVDGLLAQGFDDASTATLPLIVTHTAGDARPLQDRPVPGATTTDTFASIDASAVTLDKAETAAFAAALYDAEDELDDGSWTGTLAAGPLAGVERIWLDARVESALEESTTQIGAPTAWDLGFDGSGVTVAVLDTGIDASHADLVDRIDAHVDFTDDGDASDLQGHGTHVASIVGGTGAASEGTHRGVAPGVRLLNGKVLDRTGVGFLSDVILGAEWAAAAGADVVNMSLGSGPGSSGGALLSAVIDHLSEQHGILFVAAAGNGSCSTCIGSPADAPSALTVGAVDRGDELADFSSRGPVPGSYGLKPDLTAPGVGIAAARAGAAGEDAYVAFSGTSMAAPHVAGAAALLREARPGLDREQLKAALVATTQPDARRGPYEVGSGRLDVAAALLADVLPGTASLDLGSHPFPHEGTDPVTRSIEYTNHGTEAAAVDLTVEVAGADGASLPAEALRVEPASLHLEPGASATVELVLSRGHAAVGTSSGVVVATTTEGAQARTPIGLRLEPQLHEVRFEMVGAPGDEVDLQQLEVVDDEGRPSLGSDTPGCSDEPFWLDPCVLLPEGTYAVMGFVTTRATWQTDAHVGLAPPRHTTLVGDPEVRVEGPRTVVLDAGDAVEIHVETPEDDAHRNLGAARSLSWTRSGEEGHWTSGTVWNFPGSQLDERFFVTPMDEVTTGHLDVSSRWRLEEAAISMTTDTDLRLSPRQYRPEYFVHVDSSELPVLDGTKRLPVVDAGQARPSDLEGLELDGALVLIERSDEAGVAEQSNRAAAAGAELVVIHSDVPGTNPTPGPWPHTIEVPTYHLSREDGRALLGELSQRDVVVTAHGQPSSPYVYDLVYAERGSVPAELTYVALPDDLVTVEREFRSLGVDGLTYTETSFPFRPWETWVISQNDAVRDAPRVRTDHHVAAPDVEWGYAMTIPEHAYGSGSWEPPTTLGFGSRLVAYAEGEHVSHRFLAGPLTLTRGPTDVVARLGDRMAIDGSAIRDGDGNTGAIYTEPGIANRFQVWSGDTLLGETTATPSTVWDSPSLPELPPEERSYRIVHEVEMDVPWSTLATSTRSTWTFLSSHVAGTTHEIYGLLDLAYDLEADESNRLLPPSSRKGPNLLTIEVSHSDGIERPVEGVDVEISYDDGARWRTVATHSRGDNTYEAILPAGAPASAEALSLRVTARDRQGGGLEQEIVRAFQLPARR